ncbi:hypothetical protein DAPPUDRAFT_260984 [Daphnia pulex]|uniref:DNA-directed RNA polymerase III subunit RPC9 n=1 Tax=Daphnia pulex TaxID=6669 RepID=E9HKA5_DAPPU|nr:hypothetical protein DAPPUDRAFT_260984 [Daphnia pulex]|eukprot:EFX67851.1 hypothetical protein DAPPUDRAFT_260984 [Daphnia pulex]
MEIIDANTAMLSNFEVGSGTFEQSKSQRRPNQESKWVLSHHHAIKYLEGTPAALQSEGCFKKFLEDVKKFGLTIKEKTMILNLRPKTDVEISLIVQSTDQERLTEEQIEELIELIQNTLPE